MEGKKVARTLLTIVSVFALALLSVVYSRYHRDIDTARARISSGSQVVNTPCGLVEYAVAGKGPVVLVVHGAGGGFDQGLEIGQPLVESGFTVVAMSRFGYLRTPLPVDASPTAQADAHACLLDALNLQRVAVLGFSAGAPSAMQLCLRHPERCSAMILSVPIAYRELGYNELPPPHPSALFRFVINTTLKSDFAFWIATKLARDTLAMTILATPPNEIRKAAPDEQERVSRLMRHILPITQREKGIWNDSLIASSLPRYDLERFAVRTLVLSARTDLYGTFESARYTAQYIPGARFVGFPTGGHLLVGRQEGVWLESTAFLKALSRESH